MYCYLMVINVVYTLLTHWFPDLAVLEKKEGGQVTFRFLKSEKNNLEGSRNEWEDYKIYSKQ